LHDNYRVISAADEETVLDDWEQRKRKLIPFLMLENDCVFLPKHCP